jgi:hypothetical protein
MIKTASGESGKIIKIALQREQLFAFAKIVRIVPCGLEMPECLLRVFFARAERPSAR